MDDKSAPKSWSDAMDNLRGRYPTLSDDDLLYEEENKEKLISHLQERLGKSRREAKHIVDAL